MVYVILSAKQMAVTHLYNGFWPGSVLIVKGCVESDAESFFINLQCGPIVPHDIVSDIALHINPRFYENSIVRNTCQNGYWGCAETEGGQFFSQGQEFTVYVNCERRGFKITVDDSPFIYYRHRLEHLDITHVSVGGDVIVHEVDYKPAPADETNTTTHQSGGYLPVPFKAHLINGFRPGSILTVTGKVKCLVDRFSINLVCKSSPESDTTSSATDVALHFNVRFDNETVVRNSMVSGIWEEEETNGEFSFSRGEYFTISINCEDTSFKIFVNGSLYTCFEHRMDPRKVAYVYIHGGIELYEIVE